MSDATVIDDLKTRATEVLGELLNSDVPTIRLDAVKTVFDVWPTEDEDDES